MAWERRPSGRFYYRSVRRGSTVTKRYFGRGDVAMMAAEIDAQARQQRRDEAEALRQLRARLEPADAALAMLDDACRLALESVLTAAGFHQHRYAWRRRRGRVRPDGPRDGSDRPARAGRGPEDAAGARPAR